MTGGSIRFTSQTISGSPWTDITPLQQLPAFAKLAAIGNTLWIISEGILSSTDAGNTWENFGNHGHGQAFVGLGAAVALDEATFFLGSPSGTGVLFAQTTVATVGIRSQRTLAAPHIKDLAQVNNVLYAATYKGIATSTDGGARWAYIQPALPFFINIPSGGGRFALFQRKQRRQYKRPVST